MLIRRGSSHHYEERNDHNHHCGNYDYDPTVSVVNNRTSQRSDCHTDPD